MFHKHYLKSLLSLGQRWGTANRSGRRDRRDGSPKGVVSILAVTMLLGAMNVPAVAAPREAVPVSAAQEVAYPTNLFDNGKARHFEYKSADGVTIRYFIMKSSDGVIRAAFDACDVCWREGKGYAQKDDVMVCRNCGRRFPSVKINEVTGGCNPAALTRNVAGGKVIIRVEKILEGKKYFALLGGRS